MNNHEKFKYRIGKVLELHRVRNRFTKKEVADKIGVDRMSIYNWERGIRSLSAYNLLNFCSAIGLPLSELRGRMVAESIKEYRNDVNET